MFRRVCTCILLGCAFCPSVHGQETGAAPDAARPVEVIAAAPDEKIRMRIKGVFSQVPEFSNIEVRVKSGVVTLSGQVASSKVHD